MQVQCSPSIEGHENRAMAQCRPGSHSRYGFIVHPHKSTSTRYQVPGMFIPNGTMRTVHTTVVGVSVSALSTITVVYRSAYTVLEYKTVVRSGLYLYILLQESTPRSTWYENIPGTVPYATGRGRVQTPSNEQPTMPYATWK